MHVEDWSLPSTHFAAYPWGEDLINKNTFLRLIDFVENDIHAQVVWTNLGDDLRNDNHRYYQADMVCGLFGEFRMGLTKEKSRGGCKKVVDMGSRIYFQGITTNRYNNEKEKFLGRIEMFYNELLTERNVYEAHPQRGDGDNSPSQHSSEWEPLREPSTPASTTVDPPTPGPTSPSEGFRTAEEN